MVHSKYDRRGFSLVEIVVATAVMAMMMVSLLSYVQTASEVYQRTNQSITLYAEANSIFDSIRTLTDKALAMTPAVGSVDNNPTFTILVATGTPEAGLFYLGTITVKLMLVPGETTALVSTYTAMSPPGAGKVSFVTTEINAHDVSLSRFVGTYSQHIATLTATRLGTSTLEVYLLLESPLLDGGYDAQNATPCYEATATFFAPQINE